MAGFLREVFVDERPNFKRVGEAVRYSALYRDTRRHSSQREAVLRLMFYAVITNTQNARSLPSVPIAVGPIVEMTVDRVKLPFFIDLLFGLPVRRAIRQAFYDAEREAQTRTVRLSSYHN